MTETAPAIGPQSPGSEKSGGFCREPFSRKRGRPVLVRVVVVSSLVGACAFPLILTHHLPVDTYAAWVPDSPALAAYVSYLDLGSSKLQFPKFVARI